MSRTRALTAVSVLGLLAALVSGGCRGAEETTQQAAAPTLSQEAGRPPQGTNWSADAPPAVTGAPGFGTAYDPAAAERERQLAEREAAVAQRCRHHRGLRCSAREGAAAGVEQRDCIHELPAEQSTCLEIASFATLAWALR